MKKRWLLIPIVLVSGGCSDDTPASTAAHPDASGLTDIAGDSAFGDLASDVQWDVQVDPDVQLDIPTDPHPVDADLDAEIDVSDSGPALPASVQLQSWTCPPGWQTVTHETLLDVDGQVFSWCAPPPIPRLRVGDTITPLAEGEVEGERPICEPDEGNSPVVGEAACQPLGDPCPDGLWPELPADLPGHRVYVSVGTVGGDGTSGSPFGTINEAVLSADGGDVIVIGAGTYEESVQLSADLTLWGACPAQTVIQAPGPHQESGGGAIIIGGSANVTIRNLQVGGEQSGIRVNSEGAVAQVEDVWIHNAMWAGIAVSSGTGHFDRVLVNATRPRADGNDGTGAMIWDGATVTLSNVFFENNRNAGVRALSGSSVTLSDVVVRETQSQQSDGQNGVGLTATEQSTVTATRTVLDHNHTTGVALFDEGTSCSLEDVVLSHTQSQPSDGRFGEGLSAILGANVTASRLLVEGNHAAGLAIHGPGNMEVFEDIVVRGTQSDTAIISQGVGLRIEDGEVRVTRGLFENNRSASIRPGGEETDLTLEDVVVRTTQSEETSETAGEGMHAERGAEVTVLRALFEENRSAGVLVRTPDTHVTLEDVTIRDTLGKEADGFCGFGVEVREEAALVGQRLHLIGNDHAGVFVADENTTVTLENVTVQATESRSNDGRAGRGLEVQNGAAVVVDLGLFESNRDVSVAVFHEGTELSLSHVSIIDTLSRQCSERSVDDENQCQDNGFGTGLGVFSGAHASGQELVISGSTFVGLQLADGGYLTGYDVTISANEIGVHSHNLPDGYDLESAVTGLVVEDNTINYEDGELSVPGPE